MAKVWRELRVGKDAFEMYNALVGLIKKGVDLSEVDVFEYLDGFTTSGIEFCWEEDETPEEEELRLLREHQEKVADHKKNIERMESSVGNYTRSIQNFKNSIAKSKKWLLDNE